MSLAWLIGFPCALLATLAMVELVIGWIVGGAARTWARH